MLLTLCVLRALRFEEVVDKRCGEVEGEILCWLTPPPCIAAAKGDECPEEKKREKKKEKNEFNSNSMKVFSFLPKNVAYMLTFLKIVYSKGQN